ncbi:TPA: glycosyltransferase, partial [Clostridium perfringens]|nr:glycosyltransferase [Clostridium perfringens]
MKKLLFMVSSMNIGGVEKSLLSLLSTISREKYEITVLLLEKKGGFLNHIPSWIKVEEVSWFKEIKSIIMEAPQLTFKNY